MCVLSQQPCILRTVWLTPVIKCVTNLSKSYLVWSHSFWCDTWVTKTKRWLKLKLKLKQLTKKRCVWHVVICVWMLDSHRWHVVLICDMMWHVICVVCVWTVWAVIERTVDSEDKPWTAAASTWRETTRTVGLHRRELRLDVWAAQVSWCC